ncbi:tetratricopeptide repeat protein [Bacteroidales bacterium OttesenSCG-928-M11]|nr:tetratricopeptide repeat protein [Bacteroidales bacterium OttesenSCG-928-M11]
MISFFISSIKFINKLCSLPLFVLSIFLISFTPCIADEETKSFDYYYLEGLRLKLNGQHEEAFESFRTALDIDPSSSAALYEISRYYIAKRNNTMALESLQKAVENNPENLYYKLALAGLYRDFEQLEKAVVLYEEITKIEPERAEIHFYLSDLYLRLNNPDMSIKSLDNLENNIGMNEIVSFQKYQLYRAIDKNDKALKEIEKLSAKFPSEARYLIIIGDHYLEFQNNKKALEYYSKAHSLDPNNPYYFISMANYYEIEGKEEMVYKQIENALRNTDLDNDLKVDILNKYIKYAQALPNGEEIIDSLMTTLLSQHQEDTEINIIYADYLVSINRIEEAKFQYRLAADFDPMNKTIWLNLLRITIEQQESEEILEICNKALEYFPKSPEFYFYKGASYYIKDENENALSTFLEAIENVPHATNRTIVSEFYGHVGDLYHQFGYEKEKVYTAYDEALKLNENNVTVLNNYAYFLSLDKEDLEKAERMAAKAVQLKPNNSTYIDTYAWVLFQKENYSLAKFYIEDALSNSKDNISAEIIEHYGDILFKYGNEEKAIEEWEKALNIKDSEGVNSDLLKKKITNKTYYEK